MRIMKGLLDGQKRISCYLVIFLSIAILYIVYNFHPLFFQSVKDISFGGRRKETYFQIYRNFVLKKDVFISLHRAILKKMNVSHDDCVTLVTQTHGNLHLLEAIAERWNGPISVAVFIDSANKQHIQRVQYFYECFPKIRSNTTFHLVYPKTLELLFTTQNCSTLKTWYKTSSAFGTRVLKLKKYPYNYMRNAAVPDKIEGYIFYIDIDLVPSNDAHDNFLRFLRNNKSDLESKLFIVPTFETTYIDHIPENMEVLIKELNSGHLQIFHHETCEQCQNDTRYNYWLRLNSTNITSYEVNRTQCAYEPFFIIHRKDHIIYDERFIGRGYDRISQVSELWMAGVQFRVISNSFLVHRGLHKAPSTSMTLNQEVYTERHLEFCRAKYIEYRHFNGELQELCGEKCVIFLERKLSMQNYQTDVALQKEKDKIKWLKDLQNDEIAQYKWFLKFGDIGFLMNVINVNVSSTESERNVTGDIELGLKDETSDPNLMTFLKFTFEKWKLYKNNDRKICII